MFYKERFLNSIQDFKEEIEKEFGKDFLYFFNQQLEKETISFGNHEEELEDLKSEIGDYESIINNQKKEIKNLEQTVTALKTETKLAENCIKQLERMIQED